MANEIKARFKLDGEQEFRRSMNEAANAIKVLDSEQKLAQAQFRATGDAEAYQAEQTRILNEKIAEQQKAVKAAEEAMKQLKDKGVSPTDKTYQAWATKLNTARTRLVNMESQLDQVNGTMAETRAEADSAGDALQNVGKKLEWGNTITSLNTLNQALSSVLDTAGRIAAAVWNAEIEASRWADDLATAAAQAGIDAETYQSWQYASQFIDTEVDTITKAMNRVAKDVGSDSADIAKVFNELGVSTRNADGSARDAQDTFWGVIDALGAIDDPTQQAIYANKLFGDSWTQLKPLIDAGSEAYKNMADKGREVAVVSEQDVTALGNFNDAFNDMSSRLSKAHTTLLARIAPAMTKIANSAGNAADAFNAFLDSEEGTKAMEALNGAIDSLISSLLGEDNGAGTFASIIDLATGAVNSLTEALTWISQNGDTVSGIIKGLGIAFATLKVAPSALAFVQLLSKIPIGKLTSLFGGGSSAGSAASGAASAASAAAGSSTANGAAILVKVVNTAEIAALIAAGAESVWNMYHEVKDDHSFLGIDLDWLWPKEQQYSTDKKAWYEHVEDSWNAWNDQAYQLGVYMDDQLTALGEWVLGLFGGGKSGEVSGTEYRDSMTGMTPEGLQAAAETYNQLANSQDKSAEATQKTAEETAALKARLKELAESVTMLTMMGAPQEEINALLEEMEAIYSQMATDMEAAGETGAKNLATGINAAAAEPISAAESMAARVSAAVSSALGAVGRLGSINYASILGAASLGNYTANITLNGKKVGTMVAPIVDEVIGSTVVDGRG